MKGSFLVVLIMIGLCHTVLQAKTTAEGYFKNTCMRLGLSKVEARAYLAEFEIAFEDRVAKDMKKTWREKYCIESPVDNDSLIAVMLKVIPTKLIVPNQAELDILRQQNAECLAEFYQANQLPWNVEQRGLKKWKRKPKIPLTDLTGYFGTLKAMALNQVSVWLRTKFGLTEKQHKTVSMEVQMRLLSNDEDFGSWVNVVLDKDDDDFELVDQQPHRYVAFSDSDVPEKFINGGGGDLDDEEKRAEPEEEMDNVNW